MDGNCTDRLTIRVTERRDIEDARRLHNDNSTLMRLTDVEYITEAQQESWFQSMSTSRKSKRFTAIETATGAFVGIFRADMLDLINRNICVGLDIVPQQRGKGFAPEIYHYFMDYYFLQMGMHRLYLAVLDTNEVGRSLYAKMGFREEGRHREAIFRDGRFVDLLWMSVLRSEYDAARSGGKGPR